MLLVLVTAKQMEVCPGEDLLALDKHLQTELVSHTAVRECYSLFFNAVIKMCISSPSLSLI